MKIKKWKFREKTNLESIPSPPLPIPKLIWQMLYSRGLRTAEEIKNYISPKLVNMTSPLALDGMTESIERLIQAFLKKEKICIYADFDLDGSSGLTLLKTALDTLGFKDILHIQPKRLKEGYGFHKKLVQEISKKGVQLIITVDVGTSDFEAVEEANQLKIDVLITDHHLPKESLPNAYAIINPNKKNCSSKLGHLCGTGVAFYLALGLRVEMKKRNLIKKDFNPKDLLDCFVIGTLADMVPVTDENRVLIKHGLMVLEKTKRPGLQELLKNLDLWGKKLTSQQVSLRFAPKINALSRMEEDLLPVDLFLVKDEFKAKHFVQKTLAIHQKRLACQKAAEEEAFQRLNERDREITSKGAQRKFIFLCSKNFHKGVLGLIATRLSQEYSCSAFVGFVDEEKNVILGSARGYNASKENVALYGRQKKPPTLSNHLLQALEFSSSFLQKFGGHAMAAGFQLELKNLSSFEQSLTKYYDQQPPPPVPTVFYDGIGHLDDINVHTMDWLSKLDPFGKEFEMPVFLIKEVELLFIQPLRGGHLKFLFKEKKCELEGLWFAPPRSIHSVFINSKYFKPSTNYFYNEGAYETKNEVQSNKKENNFHLTSNLKENEKFDVLVELQWNYFKGQKKVQLLLRDIRSA